MSKGKAGMIYMSTSNARINHEESGRVYNVSTENEISNVELAKLIIKLIRPGEPIRISWIKDRIYNDKQYCTTCSNTSALGWKVAIDWQAGLSATSNFVHSKTS